MDNVVKNNKRKGKYLGPILFILICAGLGLILGFLSNNYLKDFFQKYINNEKAYIELFNIYILLLIFILGYLIHIIIHEAGHLVFGLLSGYKFVSFRVASFTIIKFQGKFKFKRFSIAGTAGQCLMMPPNMINGKYPFTLYNLGGVIFNLIISILVILIAKQYSSYLSVFFILISLGGILCALTNGIPMKINGVGNDAYNLLSMIKDKNARESFHLQLEINGLLTEGKRLKDMPYEKFKLKEDVNYKNPLNFSKFFITYNYFLDNMDFKKAKQVLKFAESFTQYTISLNRLEWESEMLFMELIGDCNEEIIEKLYNKSLQKYIKASKFMVSKKRIMMAYEGLYKKDKEKSLKYLNELKDLAENYPLKGEAEMELMLGDFLKAKLDNNNPPI